MAHPCDESYTTSKGGPHPCFFLYFSKMRKVSPFSWVVFFLYTKEKTLHTVRIDVHFFVRFFVCISFSRKHNKKVVDKERDEWEKERERKRESPDIDHEEGSLKRHRELTLDIFFLCIVPPNTFSFFFSCSRCYLACLFAYNTQTHWGLEPSEHKLFFLFSWPSTELKEREYSLPDTVQKVLLFQSTPWICRRLHVCWCWYWPRAKEL